MTTQKVIKYKINGMIPVSEFSQLGFGQQLEHLQKIREFKASAKVEYVSQKRKSYVKALSEFIGLKGCKEYFTEINTGSGYRDDTFKVWYR